MTRSPDRDDFGSSGRGERFGLVWSNNRVFATDIAPQLRLPAQHPNRTNQLFDKAFSRSDSRGVNSLLSCKREPPVSARETHQTHCTAGNVASCCSAVLCCFVVLSSRFLSSSDHPPAAASAIGWNYSGRPKRLRRRSCPQAASIWSPLRRRTSMFNPAWRRIAANCSTAEAAGVS